MRRSAAADVHAYGFMDAALSLVRGLRGLDLVGADVVEVAPPYDGPGAITSLLAANLLFELLCLFALGKR
mgnify:CR=1 FL=1